MENEQIVSGREDEEREGRWMQVAMIDGIDKVPRYVDVDHIFCTSNDEDYDTDQGVSK